MAQWKARDVMTREVITVTRSWSTRRPHAPPRLPSAHRG
jgi:hypothetical protein